MRRSETKASRLLQIEDLLLLHPEGLTQSEISRKLDVNRSTIHRDIADLPAHIYLDVADRNKWKIDRQAYLVNVRFNLDEAMAVHLASRLLATRMERQNRHAATALNKLGLALETLAPIISSHLKETASFMEGESQKEDLQYINVLEKITLAWAEKRKLKVWHRNEKDYELHQYVFSPYFIEPNAIGQSTYVIGLRQPPGELRTLKIERIEQAELLTESYEIPAKFDPYSLLEDAWGIWFTGEEPVKVTLRFSERVAHRIGETRWHRSEQVEPQEDGSLLWHALIAEPLEMLPWVRGWGADVEVLEPLEMREALKEEAHKLAQLYSV